MIFGQATPGAKVDSVIYLFQQANSVGGYAGKYAYRFDGSSFFAETMSGYNGGEAQYGSGSSACVAIGNLPYLFGCNITNQWSYSLIKTYSKGTATTKTATVDSATGMAVCATSGTEARMFGGTTVNSSGVQTAVLSKARIYTSTTDTAVNNTYSLLNARNMQATAYNPSGNSVFNCGGYSGIDVTPISNIEYWDLTANSVANNSSSLPSACATGSATLIGTDIYVFAGVISGSASNTIYKITSARAVSTSGVSLAGTARGRICSTQWQSIAYLFNGITGSTSDQVRTFNGTASAVHSIASSRANGDFSGAAVAS